MSFQPELPPLREEEVVARYTAMLTEYVAACRADPDHAHEIPPLAYTLAGVNLRYFRGVLRQNGLRQNPTHSRGGREFWEVSL